MYRCVGVRSAGHPVWTSMRPIDEERVSTLLLPKGYDVVRIHIVYTR